MHNSILLYDQDVSFQRQTSLMARKNLQDTYRDQLVSAVPTEARYVNGAYRGGSAISGYDFNHVMAGPWGCLPSQPQHNSDYSMVSMIHSILRTTIHLFSYSMKPNIPYNNPEQGETNYAGYHFGAYQVPGPTMNFSPYLGANMNQGSSPTWRFDDCWVSHAEQDKIHLTIALKKT